MTRFAVTAIVLVCLVAPGSAQGQAAPNYYPLKVGDEWTYEMTFGGRTIEAKMRVAAIEKDDKLDLAVLETVVDGKQQASEHLLQGANGVLRYKFKGIKSDPPFQLLRYPIKDKDTWTTKLTVGEEGASATCVCAVEPNPVKVPAGEFKNVVATKVVATFDGKEFHTTYWFANNVGIIKQTVEIDDVSLTLLLKEHKKKP